MAYSPKRGETSAMAATSSAQAHGKHADERKPIAHRGARRPPNDAVEIGRVRQHGARLQHADPRYRAVGKYRRHLQPDHEGGADHRGDDLRHEARAPGTDDAEQRHREADRERGRSSPHRHDQPVGAHPAQAAAHDQNIDERRGERDRHHGDRDRQPWRCARQTASAPQPATPGSDRDRSANRTRASSIPWPARSSTATTAARLR